MENEPAGAPLALSSAGAEKTDPEPTDPEYADSEHTGPEYSDDSDDPVYGDGEYAESEHSDPEYPDDSDDELFPIGARRTALPRPIESWRRRTALGVVFTGIAFGLQEALETKRQDAAIIVQTSGTPPKDLPLEADLGNFLPSRSVVHVRPWLLGGDSDVPTVEGPPTQDSTEPPGANRPAGPTSDT